MYNGKHRCYRRQRGVDDREENILAAQQLDMQTILFEQNEQAIAALQNLLPD